MYCGYNRRGYSGDMKVLLLGRIYEMPNKLAEMIPTTEVTTAPELPRVVEAPVTVVAPHTDGNRNIVGNENRSNSEVHEDRRYSSSGSNVTFSQADNSKLWEASMELLQKIADIAVRLDNIPDRLDKLEERFRIPPVAAQPTYSVPLIYNLIIALVIAFSLVALVFWLGVKL